MTFIRKKKKFNELERFAIWKCHGERCWRCTEPLSFKETTIDHFFPENLLDEDDKRKAILIKYGLNDDKFKINGFENWLPCHNHCNLKKGTVIPEFVPGNMLILNKLIAKSEVVKRTVLKLSSDKNKDKVFASILYSLDNGAISYEDLIDFINPLNNEVKVQLLPKNLIILQGGYWVFQEDIAREGLCHCERTHCVDSETKVYCYFPPTLSQWVITTGLYFKCYDEIVICPRCKHEHKRGHIGKLEVCTNPFRNQELQKD
jgi:hypothetical protein